MRKLSIVIAAIFTFTLFSCKKERQCYHCTFGIFNGVQPPPQDYCGDDGGARQFTDAQGNNLQSYCVPK